MSDGPTKYFECSDCGATIPDWNCYERGGKIYGECCLLRTKERRMQEHWFECQEDRTP